MLWPSRPVEYSCGSSRLHKVSLLRMSLAWLEVFHICSFTKQQPGIPFLSSCVSLALVEQWTSTSAMFPLPGSSQHNSKQPSSASSTSWRTASPSELLSSQNSRDPFHFTCFAPCHSYLLELHSFWKNWIKSIWRVEKLRPKERHQMIKFDDYLLFLWIKYIEFKN